MSLLEQSALPRSNQPYIWKLHQVIDLLQDRALPLLCALVGIHISLNVNLPPLDLERSLALVALGCERRDEDSNFSTSR